MQNKLKILIIGSGGREHAVGWKVAQSERAGEIFFAPGNAGTTKIGTNVSINATEISKLIDFAKSEHIGLTLALPDDPLALGVVDEFQKAGLRIWGPTKASSELEWSKAYAKDFMKRHGIPTARYGIFNDLNNAKFHLELGKFPVVIKASGLALGKGVTIAQTKEEAVDILNQIFIDRIFGDAGREVVIEEYLEGIEISIHAVSDGKSWKVFPPSQDHKRINEGDVGPNTGGMGVIAPLPFIDRSLIARIEKEIIAPTINGMREEGRPFVGCLYPGIMITKSGPEVFEFNARLGDPETQTYMRLLDSDFLDIVDACIDGTLDSLKIKWKNMCACNIVLASAGYPGAYKKGKEITGIDGAEMNKDVVVFQAGTKVENNNLVTSGGRVLGVSAVAKSLEEALDTAYNAVKKINFDGMQYRKDIGRKALLLSK
jgi:phosphoribosylamine--glycine ligase